MTTMPVPQQTSSASLTPGALLRHLNVGEGADRLRAEVDRLHQTGIRLPLLGWRLPVPPPELLTFYTGLAALAALELVDWPVAVVIAVGHELARSRRPGMRGLGESVESA